MHDQLSLAEIETFAKGAEETAHEKSREFSADLTGDENALTNHASHMRSVGAKIVLLRDGYVPALKIHPDNIAVRKDAVAAIGYIRAQFQAMELGLQD